MTLELPIPKDNLQKASIIDLYFVQIYQQQWNETCT